MKTRSFANQQFKTKTKRSHPLKVGRDAKSGFLKSIFAGSKVAPGHRGDFVTVVVERGIRADLRQVMKRRLSLHKEVLVKRVEGRFHDREAFELWYRTGKIPGYGDMTAAAMVAEGKVARVVEVLDAVEAGVYA